MGYSQNFQELEVTIDSLITNDIVPSLAVGIVKDGEIIYEKAFGYADRERKIESTINTPYQLASLSKPITATAILKLHKEGIINIDDAITKYVSLKKVNSAFQEPTIRQVLNHTAGLGTYFDIYYQDESSKVVSFEEAWDRYGIQFHEPGKVNEYSNIGYGLLSHIISKATFKTFAQYLQSNMFNELNMNDSFVIERADQKQGLLAKKYDHRLKALPFVLNNTPGAGNVASSIHDMMQFALLHLKEPNKKFLGASDIHKMQTYKEKNALFHYYQDTYYGLGWYIMEEDNGQKVVWHEGGMMGASTMLKFYPKEKIAIALLTNTHNPNTCRALADKISSFMIEGYRPTPINEVAEYKGISSDATFIGKWKGVMHMENEKVPISLVMENETTQISFVDHTYASFLTNYQPLPVNSKLLFGAINQDYFIGTGVGDLPTSDKRKSHKHLLSLKLFKHGTTLTGTIVNLAAAEREYYARPYYIQLEKTIPNK